MTKERPILFSAPMVHAIIDGRKTQTRRVVKSPRGNPADFIVTEHWPTFNDAKAGTNGFMWPQMPATIDGEVDNTIDITCPYGKPGDRLWVRESYWIDREKKQFAHYVNNIFKIDSEYFKLRPSIHMPRRASRIDLLITGVRVERLHDISEADAIAEGVYSDNGNYHGDLKGAVCQSKFRDLWKSINGSESWYQNPWVWAISFEKVNP